MGLSRGPEICPKKSFPGGAGGVWEHGCGGWGWSRVHAGTTGTRELGFPPHLPRVEAQPPTGDIPQERPHPEAPDLQKISLAKDWDMLGSSGNQELAGQQVPRL